MINPHPVQNKHILKTLWNPPFHTLVQAYVFVLKWKDWTWPSFHLFVFHFVILLIDLTVIFKYKMLSKKFIKLIQISVQQNWMFWKYSSP